MKDHFRFASCYWHTFRGMGGDPFGPGCHRRPWEDGTDSVDMAIKRVHVAFEFFEKLGVPFFCFHDRDVAPEGKNLRRDQRQPRQDRQGHQGRACSAPASSCSGAPPICSATPATSTARPRVCNADVFAYAAAQVKKCLEVTKELGGENYVFWGGREGYSNLYNTDMKRELDHLAKFFHLAVDYKKKIGFTRPVPDRAEAEGADRSPVRLRRRRRASPSCVATAWPITSSSTSRPTTPPWPGTR